ncbi:MAG: hypothetical protein K2J37_05535 [Ruminococcus sp.]|nr:hypothetical protein [Ruminococcus sp.]MDE6783890.1 hypothetical protein [Ruminococcus sp.]
MFKLIGFKIKNGYFTPPESKDDKEIYWSNVVFRFLTDESLGNSVGVDVSISKIKTLYLLNYYKIYSAPQLPENQAERQKLETQLFEFLKSFVDKEVEPVVYAVGSGDFKENAIVGYTLT